LEGSNPILSSSLKRRRADLPTQRRKDYICERERDIQPERDGHATSRATPRARIRTHEYFLRAISNSFRWFQAPDSFAPGGERARAILSPPTPPLGHKDGKGNITHNGTTKECNQSKKNEKKASRHRSRTGTATLFVCVFLLTDATETHLFVIWAIADMFLMFVCFILSAEYEVWRG
jgi:hypothetical protein